MDFSIESILFHLNLLHKVTGVPLSILDTEGKVNNAIPFDECGVDFSISPSVTPGIYTSAQEFPFFDFDNQSTIYSLIPIENDDRNYIFVGPVKIVRDLDISVYQTGSSIFSHISMAECEAILSVLPVMNFYDFIKVVQLLYFELTGKEITSNQFFMKEPESTISADVNRILFSRRETSVYHHSYIGELLMGDVIRKGQLDKFWEAARFAEKGVPGVIHQDPVRNMKDLGIITITIITRPAIQGGVSDEIAYAMSDAYMREIEACESYKEVIQICFRAAYEYTSAVANIRKKTNFSSNVLRCIDYLQAHLHEKIVLSDISEILKINSKQLSAAFKNETGLSITNYIHQERVEEAKSLLAHSDLSFSDISNFLNYCNQSYFTSIFNKFTGTTPSAYREQHYKTPIIDLKYSVAEYMKEIMHRENSPNNYSASK